MDHFTSASEDDVVERLMKIWSEVLVSGVVDQHTDFVELGGTSLTAVRIRGRVRTDFGRDLDLEEILDYPTPRALAPRLHDAPPYDEPS